jgi:hypothetical protein
MPYGNSPRLPSPRRADTARYDALTFSMPNFMFSKPNFMFSKPDLSNVWHI